MKRILFPLFLTLFLAGCKSTPFEHPEYAPVPSAFKPETTPEKFMFQSRMTLDFGLHEMASLVMAAFDGNQLSVAATTPAGVKWMELSGRPGAAEKWYFYPNPHWPRNPKEAADVLLQDFANIFLNPPVSAKRTLRGGMLIQDTPDAETRVFAGNPPRLIKKMSGNSSSDWQSGYFRYIIKNGTPVFPDRIVYDNFRTGYRLIFRVYSYQDTKR